MATEHRVVLVCVVIHISLGLFLCRFVRHRLEEMEAGLGIFALILAFGICWPVTFR